MKCNTSSNQIILSGNINDVLSYLKECQKNYKYVKELIEEINSINSNSSLYKYIN